MCDSSMEAEGVALIVTKVYKIRGDESIMEFILIVNSSVHMLLQGGA